MPAVCGQLLTTAVIITQSAGARVRAVYLAVLAAAHVTLGPSGLATPGNLTERARGLQDTTFLQTFCSQAQLVNVLFAACYTCTR